jgi:hypothetical protein
MSKPHKKLADVIGKYGLTLELGKGHYEIKKGGKYITSVSSTPSDPHFARQTIRCLVRDGHLPIEAKTIKF